jgi:arylsulfatase A-like enzyme
VLQEAWDHTDQLIGSMVNELKAQNLMSSTLIIITGVHAQTPMEVRKRHLIDQAIIPGIVGADLAKATYDDIDLIWLKDQSRTAQVVARLTEPENEAKAGIQSVLWGESLKLLFSDPLEDSRVPDIIVIPNFGVMYGQSTSVYRAEHGGFTHEDTNVPLMLSNPRLSKKVIKSILSTTEAAPTILKALGLDPNALDAVRIEYTRVLPGFFTSP